MRAALTIETGRSALDKRCILVRRLLRLLIYFKARSRLQPQLTRAVLASCGELIRHFHFKTRRGSSATPPGIAIVPEAINGARYAAPYAKSTAASGIIRNGAAP